MHPHRCLREASVNIRKEGRRMRVEMSQEAAGQVGGTAGLGGGGPQQVRTCESTVLVLDGESS